MVHLSKILVKTRHSPSSFPKFPLPLRGVKCAGQKGSDASAREATRKLVSARRQLLKLHQVLLAFGSVPSQELQGAADAAADGLKQAPRNMIVRNTLKTLR